MEYTWHMEEAGSQDRSSNRRNQGPGLIEDLEAFMTPGVESYAAADRRPGYEGLPWGHQLPESPPDSGSENPYSPSENVHHAISVPQTVLSPDSYMLVADHIPTHEILQQNNAYIYEELKTNGIDHEVLRSNLENVVVMPQDPNIMELGAVRHDLGMTDHNIAFNRYHQMRVEMPELDPNLITPPLVALSHETLTPVYSSLQEPSSRKRKHSQDVSQVKCEPAALSPESSHTIVRPAPPSVDGSEAGDDAPMQCIRFSVFQQNTWHTLYDCNFKLIPTTSYLVGADKGFNYSQIDEAFVCQKKNHFQVTCQIQVPGEPHYVKTADGFKKINNFRIHFYGIKAEDPSQEVRIEQSQSDRTKKPFHPVPVEIRREGTKMTVCRLHFAETTNNNMRKKGRPNPDQRHFQLVVSLRAHSQQAEYTIAAQASDRIIVRASNPGQFESDCTENWWQRGVSDNSVHFNGRVGINTDRPDESCVINGNLKLMGHLVQPSDARAKHNIAELDTAQQLRNVQNIRVVKFDYDPSFAQHSGLLGFDPTSSAPQSDTGVIAQEVRQVLPEAVKEAGDVTLPNGDTIQKFLVVNKDRIFMENLGAVKELCKVTGHLESRIDQLEKKYNKKLSNLGIQRRDSARSSISNDSHFSIMSNTSKSFYNECNIDHIRDIARNIRRHECCHKLSHNSPKYIRRQCKNCHGTSKLGKYYNYNKTCARYNKNDKEDSRNYPPFETLSPIQNSENYSSMAKSKDTCIWLREDNLVCGSSRLALCCQRKDRYGEDTELISNKLLQIIITVLIFIMAVCLVVMSVLYFREHQELLSMREIKHEKYMNYPYTGKYTAPAYTPPDPNQIQNPKLSLHPNTKKSRDKVPLKTTPEYPTTRTEPRHTTTTINPLKGVGHYNNMDSPPHISQEALEIRNKSLTFDKIIGRCATTLNNDNKLDAECQDFLVFASFWLIPNFIKFGDQTDDRFKLSCLDPSQTYENQEPLEKTLDKEDSVPRPMIPVIPERNITESLKNDLKKTIQDDISITANDIDMTKQNNTDNGKLRLKRGAKELKKERETNEALPESKDWSAEDQNIVSDCITTTVGIWSPSIANTTLFSDEVCETAIHNYTYTVPLAQCLQHRYVHVTFRTTSLSNMLFLCDLQCAPDGKGCAPRRAPPAREPWSTKVDLDCNTDTTLKIRAGAVKDLCDITVDDKIPFMEYNIHLKQSCHN